MKKKSWILISIIFILALCLVFGNKESKKIGDGTETEQSVKENVEENVENKEQTSAEVTDDNLEAGEQILEEKKEHEKPQVDWLKAKKVYTTADVNLREEPNTDCAVIRVLDRGKELQMGSSENGWAYVQCGEYVGYVNMKYIAEERPQDEVKESSLSKVEAIPGQYRDPNNIVVVIDPGHQGKGDSTKEPNGPGSSTMKARVTSGCTGVASGVPEYKLVLEVSLKLKAELENRGYTVKMTRTSHDVNISNMERAKYATEVNADIAVRIHADSVDDESVRGATVLVPSSNNAYVSHLAKASNSLGQNIINSYCGVTGFKNRGVKGNDTMTGINWSEVPVAILELGFMSNPTEDLAMQDSTMQNNMVQGIANGVDDYFGL